MLRLARVCVTAVVVGLWLWLIPSAFYLVPEESGVLRVAAAACVAMVPPLLLLFAPRALHPRRVVAITILAAYVAWLGIPAFNEGDWSDEYARIPTADFEGDIVTIHNVRNFEYRTERDFTPRWYDARYDLSELETLDFIKVHWGIEAIAHTMLSFGFRDGRYLTVSVETRRRKGQDWSSIAGFFKQYTLAYVLGDERDLVRLRTNYRGENVYLYPTNTSKEAIRTLFIDIVETASLLAESPRWYNTISDNCTTSLARHIRKISGRRRWDPRLLVNGHTDEMGIESGWITPHGSIEETRAFYYVNPKVDRIQDPSDYSSQLRAGL